MPTFIHEKVELLPKKPNGRTILYMQGYGGRRKHSSWHLKVLLNAGYHIYYLDFYDVFRGGNHKELLNLVDEVDDYVKSHVGVKKDLIIVGVSLGGLIGFNLLRRHEQLKNLIVITGGDITHIPSLPQVRRRWNLNKKQLDKLWRPVNIYTQLGRLSGKNIIMVLPKNDRVINPGEVIDEINRHKEHNFIKLIRTPGGHYRTIISQTIVRPRKTLGYIKELDT